MRYDDDFPNTKADASRKSGSQTSRSRLDSAQSKRPRADLPKGRTRSDAYQPSRKRSSAGSQRNAKRPTQSTRATRPVFDDDFDRPIKRTSQGSRKRYDDDFDRPIKRTTQTAYRRYDDDFDRPIKRTTQTAHRRYDDDFESRPKRKPYSGRKRNRSSAGATFLWIVLALVAAFGISLALHANVFETVRISGDSMYATLDRGDIVIINKLDKSLPGRGDLVAINLPGENSCIVRRVVGLPGETVSIEEGKTYIDGNAITEKYIGLENYDSFDGVTLPTGKYYVLCDNRTDMSDSRANDISMVGKSQIDGQVSFRIWPLARFGNIQ